MPKPTLLLSRRRTLCAGGVLMLCVLTLLLIVDWQRQAPWAIDATGGNDQAAGGPADPCSPSALAHERPDEIGSRRGAAAPAPTGAYLGVWQPGVPEDMSQLDAFVRAVGKSPAIVMLWRDSADDAGALDLGWLCQIAARGAVPLISWTPSDWRGNANQSPDRK